jgi:hypothetical protein
MSVTVIPCASHGEDEPHNGDNLGDCNPYHQHGDRAEVISSAPQRVKLSERAFVIAPT